MRLIALVSCSLLLVFTTVSVGQQVADPNFDPMVERYHSNNSGG